MPAWNDYKDEAKSRGALAMELFVVTTKPCGDSPVSDASGEQMNAEGMIIYRAENLAAARVLADADPMHAVGARRYEIRKWLVNEGKFNFSIALSTQAVDLA